MRNHHRRFSRLYSSGNPNPLTSLRLTLSLRLTSTRTPTLTLKGFTKAEMERSGTEVGSLVLSMNKGATAEVFAQVVRSVCLVYSPFLSCLNADVAGACRD